MRNSYLRPLSFNYIDTYQKKYETSNIPAKFLQEPDNYQERVKRPPRIQHSDSLEQNDELSNYAQTPTALKSHQHLQGVQKVDSMTFEAPFVNKLASMQSERIIQEEYKEHQAEQRPPKKSNSIFTCCSQREQESEVCGRCMRALCGPCLTNPQDIKRCTKCLQKICKECKTNLGIDFPNYKLRNYPINFKKVNELHFKGCTCNLCSTTND